MSNLLDLCICGHDVEDHNDIWKLSTTCGVCDCSCWVRKEEEEEEEVNV